MKKLNKEQLEQIKTKISVIKGLYRASKDGLNRGGGIRAGDIRRYNVYLEQMKEITNDNEFINFSVSATTSWDNDDIVNGAEFNSNINQFLEYIKVAYNQTEESYNIKSDKWIYYTNPFWISWYLIRLIPRYKFISIILILLTILAFNYSLAWENIKTLYNLIERIFK